MVQIHRKHLTYGQNCPKDRLIGLLGVAYNRVTNAMQRALLRDVAPRYAQLHQQSR
jgi:hypothetical protein